MRSVITALVLLTACCSPGLSPDAPREVARVWHVSTGDGSYGTGFPIKCILRPDGKYDVLVLTAKHVIDNPRVISATLGDRYLYRGREVNRHPTLDATLLRFESTEPVRVLSLREETTYAGEALWVAGFGGGDFWVSSGFASAVNRASIPVFLGDSGSPIFDREGLVVGIVSQIKIQRVPWSAGVHLVHHHCLFVPAASLTGWLKPLLD